MMNTLWTPLNNAQIKHGAVKSRMQVACGLMLGSLLALPAGAVQERNIRELRDPDLNNISRNVGPVAQIAPIVNPNASTPSIQKSGVTQGIGPQKLTPPGAGPTPPHIRVVNNTPPPEPAVSARTLPPMSNPSPGAGTPDVPIIARVSSPPVKGGPGQGAGPGLPPRQGQNPSPGAGAILAPEPVARVALPMPPTQGAGPSLASPSQPSAAATVNPAPNTSAVITLAPAPVGPVDPQIRTQNIPTTGAGETRVVSSIIPDQQSNRLLEPQLGFGAAMTLSTTSAASPGRIVEILPGAKKLSESMRVPTAAQQQGIEKDTIAAVNSDKCVPVGLRPDSQRPGLSLVDLTGDGLIVSAVPDAHIQSVFAKAGYRQPDLSQTARWCITQIAARALVRPSTGVSTQQAALLVQTGTGLQLMSQDQWVAHQASINPQVMAMTTPKTSKLNKPTDRLVAKRSSKPAAAVVVGALRVPGGSSKASAGA